MWVECQLDLGGVTATQNNTDNLKLWADINNNIEKTMREKGEKD